MKQISLIPLNPCPMCGSTVNVIYMENARYRFECDACGQYFEFNAPSQLTAESIFNHIIAKEREENA